MGRIDTADDTCALTSSGGVKCWGRNLRGLLGDGTTTDRHAPVDVFGLDSGVQAIAAGDYQTCALTTAGGVKCWGNNEVGELGDGSTRSRSKPGDVSGLARGVTAISGGLEHTCALTSAGGVRCWGSNRYGELGDGTTTDRHEPVSVSGLDRGVIAISAAGEHTCALTNAGGVKCWGSVNGFGHGPATNRSKPVDIAGLANGVTAISAGFGHNCALMSAGSVKCWGDNDAGQLGDGTTTGSVAPLAVSGLDHGVIAISAGVARTCAVTSEGGAKCWGDNEEGELGDGTTTNRSKPVDVAGLASGVTAISTGLWNTCALTSAGRVKCWGYNKFGEVGDGTATARHKPVDVVGFP